jgi:hypothetical protein
LVCGQVNFWYALSPIKLLLQKNPRTLIVDRCLSFYAFSFGHCIVCPSSIYGFWYIQIFLPCVVIMIPPFLRQVPLVKQELLILPQQTSSSLCRNHDPTLSMTSATSEAGTAYPSTANKFTSGFCWVRIVQTNCYVRFLEIIFLFSCSFSFGHPLYCLSDLHLLIIPVVSSNFS